MIFLVFKRLFFTIEDKFYSSFSNQFVFCNADSCQVGLMLLLRAKFGRLQIGEDVPCACCMWGSSNADVLKLVAAARLSGKEK